MPDTVPPWLTSARAKVGKLHDGRDVVLLAQDITRALPEQAAYWGQARPETSWCSIFVAHELVSNGVPLPGPNADGVGAMYVNWWLSFGTEVEVGQERPGDLALWLGNPHHISFVAGDGKYVGGNQSDGVTETHYRVPDAIRRPPAATAETVLLRPEIERGAQGVFVIELQKLLGITVTGIFDDLTGAAVRAFQASHGLEVDGIVGEETWPALLAATGPRGLPQDAIDKIVALAGSSELARYSWADRGVAPRGYIKGMAVTFAHICLKLKSRDPTAVAMAREARSGDDERDALVWYAGSFPAAEFGEVGEQTTLRHLFTILIGLGMRESSGRYCEGRDQSADNTSADTAEAGLFQQSWDSRGASSQILVLMADYLAKPGDGFQSIFAEGVTPRLSELANFGSGDGEVFQRLCKTRPAFAVEAAAIGLRVLRKHWGPINRHEAEVRPEADRLLAQVQAIVDAIVVPIEGEVIPPITQQDAALALLIIIISKEKNAMDENIKALWRQERNKAVPNYKALLDLAMGEGPATIEQAKPEPAQKPTSSDFEFEKYLSLLPDPTVKKILTVVTLPELAMLAARVKALMRGEAPQVLIPDPPPPPPAPTPILEKPGVPVSLTALGGSIAAIIAGLIGTPLGFGVEPTTAGTVAIVAPALSTLMGMTGIWGKIAQIALPMVGSLLSNAAAKK